MQRLDGMGTDVYRERERMARAHHDTGPSFTHDVVAVDENGEVLYATEALFPNEVDDALEGYAVGDDAPEDVDHYEIRER